MTLTDLALQYFRRAEGWDPRAYLDSRNFWTIGCGRNIHHGKDGKPAGPGLRDCEIAFMLQNDLADCVTDIRFALNWFDSISLPRQLVLVSMRFQLGLSEFLKFQPTFAHIVAGQFGEAAQHIRGSLAARQTPERWRVLADVMETGNLPEGLR